ncbi:RNase P modulator RnpM [Terrilactibacillus tamarindi]|nr:YlxR family protein [Terrilactibacillus tamarindi]
MKKRKVPMRKCIVTQESAEKKALFRVVRSPEGEVSLDLTGRKNGRGAYISMKREVVDKAESKKLLSKHLEAEVPQEVFQAMRSYLEENHID